LLNLLADFNYVFDGIWSCPHLDQKRKKWDKAQLLKGIEASISSASQEGPMTVTVIISHVFINRGL